jgi:hypothetical protein
LALTRSPAQGARPHRDLPHIIDVCLAFVYHVSEVSARVVTIGLFATAAGSWVFLVFLCHALTVTALLRFPPTPELAHIWCGEQPNNPPPPSVHHRLAPRPSVEKTRHANTRKRPP